MLGKVNRAKVADGDFIFAGVQGDFCTQIRRVNHADMLLWATQVAWVFKGDPRVACFEQHRQDLAPQVCRFYALEQF